MEVIGLVGRILFGGFFVFNGLSHFAKMEAMAGYSASKRVPMPKLAVAASGTLIILGGLGIILNMYVKESALLLIAFLIPVTFTMHRFWTVQDPMAKMGDRINFLKNIALLGAALMIFAAASWKIIF